MSKKPDTKPSPKASAKEQRDARMKAALRGNLQKRKAQGRARKSSETPENG